MGEGNNAAVVQRVRYTWGRCWMHGARVRGAAIGGWAELHWGLPRAASRDFAFFFGWVPGGCRQIGGSGGEDGVEVEVEVMEREISGRKGGEWWWMWVRCVIFS